MVFSLRNSAAATSRLRLPAADQRGHLELPALGLSPAAPEVPKVPRSRRPAARPARRARASPDGAAPALPRPPRAWLPPPTASARRIRALRAAGIELAPRRPERGAEQRTGPGAEQRDCRSSRPAESPRAPCSGRPRRHRRPRAERRPARTPRWPSAGEARWTRRVLPPSAADLDRPRRTPRPTAGCWVRSSQPSCRRGGRAAAGRGRPRTRPARTARRPRRPAAFSAAARCSRDRLEKKVSVICSGAGRRLARAGQRPSRLPRRASTPSRRPTAPTQRTDRCPSATAASVAVSATATASAIRPCINRAFVSITSCPGIYGLCPVVLGQAQHPRRTYCERASSAALEQ